MKKGQQATQSLPILPLKNVVLFPSLFMPLSIGRPLSLAAVEFALGTEEKCIALFTQRDPMVEVVQEQDLYRIGTRCLIKKVTKSPTGMEVLIQGTEKLELLSIEKTSPFLQGNVRRLGVSSDYSIFQAATQSPEIEALRRSILELVSRMIRIGAGQSTVDIEQMIDHSGTPLQQAYLVASMLSLDTQREQSILEASTILDTLRLLHKYMEQEIQILELRHKIATEAQDEMGKQQREYILRQQMDAIQKELGEMNPEKAEIQELSKKLQSLQLPEKVLKEAERELKRLERVPPAAPDYQVIRTYLDLLLDLPWSSSTQDVFDLVKAREILDADHYDLQEIKDRILEHLAVLKLNPRAKAPIICFVGPPGVGKTSLGQSIAKALGKKFERMSLGGLHDEAELRGHRRTYIGAMPGRILQALRRVGVNNPLLFLDEVDKLGRDFRGDPAAALLEILDPAQNHAFRDNYLDLPFDLSRIFFITTANTLDTVPGPLLDRMEIIPLSGYTEEEKLQIARRYLIPRRIVEAGLDQEKVQISTEALKYIIESYTREAGVRELERHIGRIASKVAKRFAEGRNEPVLVEVQQLGELLGSERFRIEKARELLPPGVAIGLAWTPAGGEILFIEAALMPGSEELRITGQLGDVMKESAQAAQSYLWSNGFRWGIDPTSFKKMGMHLHIPAGAIPKDGPSAGVAMVCAMASAFLKRACDHRVAMTGEITLSGLILPVGGIKEKVLAAKRAGIQRVILPLDNQKNLREIPEDIQHEMQMIWVDQIEGVLKAAIPELTGKRLTVAS